MKSSYFSATDLRRCYAKDIFIILYSCRRIAEDGE